MFKFNVGLLLSIVATIALAPNKAEASCPVQPCNPVGKAQTIAGSNAHTTLIQLNAQMVADSTDVAQKIVDASNAQISAISSGTQGIISTMMEMNQASLDMKIKGDKAMLDAKMAYQSQLAELEYRSQVSAFGKGDTKEEIDFILKTLDENTDITVPEIIYMLKTTIDEDPEGKISVQIFSSEGVCSEEEVKEDGLCAMPVKIFPSTKLEKAFKACSASKRLLALEEQESKKQQAIIAASNEKTAKAAQSTDSAGAVAARIETNKELACSPVNFKNGVCGKGMTPEEYQEKIILGTIIPNGDIMASNLTTPTAMTAEGYIEDLEEETYKDIVNQALDRRKLEAEPNQKVVPIYYTYRNANQVKAAMAFVDNVISDDLVPNQSAINRRKASSAEYQAYFLSRLSSLSAARMVLNDSMMLRVGTKLGEMISDGSINGEFEITMDSENGKEDVLGAGPLDLLKDRVDRQFGSLQISEQNPASGNANASFINGGAEGDALNMQNEALRLQNELMFKSYMMGEQSLTLDAITLSQRINSPRVIKHMKDLRGK